MHDNWRAAPGAQRNDYPTGQTDRALRRRNTTPVSAKQGPGEPAESTTCGARPSRPPSSLSRPAKVVTCCVTGVPKLLDDLLPPFVDQGDGLVLGRVLVRRNRSDIDDDGDVG